MALKAFKSRTNKELKWPKIIIAILSTIGLVDTGSITLKNWGLFTSLSCPGIQNGCESVLNSPWGTLFKNNQVNIPLSLAGFITYLSILVLTIILSINLISPKEKLNVDDAQDIRNTNHHKNLFSFSFGEIKLSESIIVITNIDKYVINPAKERGILT